MDDSYRDSSDPKKQVEWAVSVLKLTYPELQNEYPSYPVLDGNRNLAKEIVRMNPELASEEALRLLCSLTEDREGYSTMCLIQGISINKTAEWVSYLKEARSDPREAVRTAAEESLGELGLNIQSAPGPAAPDVPAESLVSIISGDKGDMATPEDVLLYQEAMDRLIPKLKDENIGILLPLFSHKYWRVRKHAVMTSREVLSGLNRANQQSLRELLSKMARDPDDTVRAMAKDY